MGDRWSTGPGGAGAASEAGGGPVRSTGFCLRFVYFREPELTFLSRTDAPSLLRPTWQPKY